MKSYEENKRKLLKTSPLFLFALLLMLSSCDVSKRITYFQDIQEQQTTYVNEQPSPEIRLRPEDKVSIIVNTKVPELTTLFNLPYTPRVLGSNADASLLSTSYGSSSYIIKAAPASAPSIQLFYLSFSIILFWHGLHGFHGFLFLPQIKAVLIRVIRASYYSIILIPPLSAEATLWA